MNSNEEKKEDVGGGHGCRRRCWKIPFIVAGIVLIKSAVVLLLWNALIPGLLHLPALGYVQAIELTILAKLLFGFGGPRHHFGHWKGRWAHLSQEERSKLREEIRNRCGD